MGVFNQTNANTSNKKTKELPKTLSIYENSDFSVQQKARFLYYLCISIIGCLLIMVVYTGYIEINSSIYNGLYLPVIIPEIVILLIVAVCLFLIVKGFFAVASHLLVISTVSTLWIVMWMDKGDAIARLDTIVFILAILSMLPLLITRYKSTIILYVISNIAMLYIFMFVNKNNLNLSYSSTIDYMADLSIALIFIGIVGYSIYNINKRALAQAIKDTKERLLAEEKLKKSDEGYRYMFEMNPQPMYIYDFETLAIIEANNAALEHYGYSHDEFLNLTLKDIRPAEDIPKFLDDLNQINSSYSRRGISRHLKKNGEIFYVDIAAHSITYEGRKARHIMINDNTERIQAELALAESEKKFREMTDLLPQIVFEADKNGILTYANKKGYEQYGFTDEGFKKGINVFSTLIEDDRVRASENINLTLIGLPAPGNQYTALRRDGSKFPVQIFSSAIKDNQTVIGLRGIVIDTTDRIKAEEEIKQSRDQFQSLVSNIPGITYRCRYDKDWTMLYLSSEVNRLSGYQSEDFINNKVRTYESVILPEDSHRVAKEIETAINEARSWEVEYRIIHMDGSLRWVYEKGRAVFNDTSEVEYLDGFILDITERKKTDELLKESELRYKTLIETSQDGISLMDLNGTMLFVNTRKVEMVGASSETFLVGTNAFSLLTENSRLAISEIMPKLFQQGYMDNLEANVQRFDGTTFNAEFNVTVLKDNNGVPIYLMDTMRDITERKIFEEKLKQSEQFRRRVFDSSKIPIVVMDAVTYQFIDINTSGINIYGFSSYNEALGKTPVDVSAVFQYDGTPSPQKATFYVEQALVNGSITFEWLHRRNNGDLWDAEVHLLSFQSDNKTLLQFSLIDITERKKAVNDLIESEVRYRTLFDNAQIGIYQTTPDGKILTANPALLDMLGFESISELEKRNLETDNVYIDSTRDDFKKIIERDGIIKNFESNWLCKNGEVINIIENASVVCNINGETLYYDGFVENITDRKRNEKNLKESEEKYRTLMESMNEVVMMVDNEDKVRYINKKFTEKLGYQPEEVIGEIGFKLLYDPIDKENIISKTHNDNNLVNQYEVIFAAKDGHRIYFLVNTAPVNNAYGEPLGSIIAMVDITEKKLIEKELMLSEEKYRTLMESMNEVVIMADNDHKVLYVNKKFTEKLGYTPEEIIGRIGYKMLNDPEDLRVVENANSDRLNNIQSNYELAFIAKDGKKYDFMVSGAPVKNSKGEVFGSIGTMMDITEKKIVEKELEQYRNNLEILVKERTEELEASNEELTSTNEELYHQRRELEIAMTNLKDAQNKLIQSEKMASLGVLAAGVAHEINNPLNFIHGGIAGIESYINENLKDHIPEVAPLIEGIQVGVKRAADIVMSLNHYSRKDDLPSTECNVHEIIDNCLVMLNNKIWNRIKIIKEYDAQPVTVFCNEGRLHQVFLNIIANSTQAIENTGTINIFTKTKTDSITISISDSGCGIDANILPKITDPFFTTKDPGKGTGLGLSITYSIIKEYNGTLEFESKIGEGTKAIITLPFN